MTSSKENNSIKPTILLFIFILLGLSSFSQGTGKFHTEGERIISPSGDVFILRGANIPGPRFSWSVDIPIEKLASKVEEWGMNGVRVAWRNFQKKNNDPCGYPVEWEQNQNPSIEDYVKEFVINRGLVLIIDNHDWYGENLVNHPCVSPKIRNFFVDMAKAFGTQSSRSGKFTPGKKSLNLSPKEASKIWFDLRNEPLRGSEDSNMKKLKTEYDKTIKAIRETGANNIILLEGSRWGRDSENPSKSWIKTYGPYFRDQYNYIVFSHHSYGWKASNEDNPDYGDLTSYYQWMIDHNMPILNGELSKEEGGIEVTRYAYGEIDKNWCEGGFKSNGALYKKGISRLYWSFWGGDDADLTTEGGGHYIQFNGNCPVNLTEEGKIIWADIKRGKKLWKAPCGGTGCN